MSKRDEFHKTMEENLAVGGARLDAVRGRNRTAPAGQRKAAQERRIEEWHARGEVAAAKLEQLKTSDSDQWDVIKHEMAKEWHDLDLFMGQTETAERTPDGVERTSTSSPPVGTPSA